MTDVLRVEKLNVGYGDAIAVRDLDLHVGRGEVVSLLGANGAGKTTTLMAIAGALGTRSGVVSLNGRPLAGPLHRRAGLGVSLVPEQKSVFMGMSVEANLRLGRGSVDRALELFPELRRLLQRPAGLCSGGEQQILTLARALAADPEVLLVDELSLGLAPMVVGRLLEGLRAAASRGVGVLVVDQHARRVLRFSDRAYVLHRGEMVLTGTGSEMLSRIGEVEATYLGSDPVTGN